MRRRSDLPRPVRWGEPPPGLVRRLFDRVRAILAEPSPPAPRGLPPLPSALRRGEGAATYLAAERERDHRRAGVVAASASEQAIEARAWWPADAWAHRALWHFERAEMPLDATRAARRIGDVRVLGGDPLSARRYYAEAISEARDIGAEREEGLAAYGMGRAELQLGNVTTARRLAQIAIDLLERCDAPAEEVGAALELRGEERRVGGDREAMEDGG